MFAALSSIEIAVVPVAQMNDFQRDKEWPRERRAEGPTCVIAHGVMARWRADRAAGSVGPRML